MASQGATLQNYNNQLVQYIEELKEKREELNSAVMSKEEEQQNIQRQMMILQEALKKIDMSLQLKYSIKNDYDKVIRDTEGAYMKVNSNVDIGKQLDFAACTKERKHSFEEKAYRFQQGKHMRFYLFLMLKSKISDQFNDLKVVAKNLSERRPQTDSFLYTELNSVRRMPLPKISTAFKPKSKKKQKHLRKRVAVSKPNPIKIKTAPKISAIA